MFSTQKRVVAIGSLAALALSGCYVVPVAPDGTPVAAAYAVPYAAPAAPARTAAPIVAGTPYPSILQARLYPANEAATKTGMLSGTVTNYMTGTGRFQLDLAGETLVGEATRISGNDRKGVANAYGRNGTYMSCEYLMNTPYQGTGTCTMSNGARYSVHVGS